MAKDVIYVKEDTFSLFYRSEENIIDINSDLNDKFILSRNSYGICWNSAQAVEKMLKGYIKENGFDVRPIHNLIELVNSAINIDKSFKDIEKDCNILNQYNVDIKYDSIKKINRNDIKETIIRLKNIYNFEPLKKIRERFLDDAKYPVAGDINLLGTEKMNQIESIALYNLGNKSFSESLGKNQKIISKVEFESFYNDKENSVYKYIFLSKEGQKLYSLETKEYDKDNNITYKCYIFDKNFDIGSISEFIRKYQDKIERNRNIESMECIKQGSIKSKTIHDLVVGETLKNIENYNDNKGNNLYKSEYVNGEKDKIYVLERVGKENTDNFNVETWYFKNNFSKESAINFIEQYDNWKTQQKKSLGVSVGNGNSNGR
jgi:HEPN domain-containing protein